MSDLSSQYVRLPYAYHTASMQYGRSSTITVHTTDSMDRLKGLVSWSSMFAYYIRVFTTIEGTCGKFLEMPSLRVFSPGFLTTAERESSILIRAL
jgi:hypothetical protein